MPRTGDSTSKSAPFQAIREVVGRARGRGGTVLAVAAASAAVAGAGASEASGHVSTQRAAPSHTPSTQTVRVDLTHPGAKVRHRASGFLHGFSPTTPDREVRALKPVLFRGRIFGTGNVSDVYDRVRSMGATPEVVLSDTYNNYAAPFPGDGGDWTGWERYVRGTVEGAVQSGRSYDWDIWNEPNLGYFWGRDRAQFFEAWTRAVRVIRQVDPNATIVGPSLAFLDRDWMDAFLRHAARDQVLPDILSWHELGPNPDRIGPDVAWVKKFVRERGLPIRGIQLNEIVGPTAQTRPGDVLWTIANVERAGVTGAAKGCWQDAVGSACDNTSLDGLLNEPGDQPRSAWQAYAAYARMSGVYEDLQPTHDVDGLASLDRAAHQARVVIGDHRDHPVRPTLKLEVPAKLVGRDGKVKLRVRAIEDRGPVADPKLPAPTTETARVRHGEAKVRLPRLRPHEALEVVVGPDRGR